MAVLALLPVAALGYTGKIHQRLTFIAARQFNDCAQKEERLPRLSALETRYMVKANVAQAETGVFTRMFRWSYYNRADQTGRSAMWGLIDTRFHDHFEALVDETRWLEARYGRLKNLGRIVNYIQAATAPARVVPVYTGRWWRFSLSDRFENYPLDVAQVEAAVVGMCAELLDLEVSFQDMLEDVANRTIDNVRAPIFGFPTTWEAYWRFARDDDDFGEYGPAGNAFGQRTEFRCGNRERCLLLKDDPLYRDFANAQHILAVMATMRAIALLQQDEVERLMRASEEAAAD